MYGALVIALAIPAAPQQQVSIDQLPTWRVEPTPLVVIGTNDTRSGHALHRVQGATRLSDGRIVIADGGSAELRFFSPAGVLEARAGRQGRGPEEFRNIANIATGSGDTILVLTYDPAIAWVSPDAGVLRKVPLDIGAFRLACSMTEGDMKQILPDASILVLAEEAFGQSGCKPRPIRLGQGQDLVGRYDPGRKRLDTLGTFQGAELEGRFYRTFGQIVAVAASPDRLFAASTGTNTIQTFSYDGERLGAWISPHKAQPVPERLKNLPPRTTRTVTLPDGTVERPTAPDVADTFPAIGRLLTDRGGNLWIMAYPIPNHGIASYSLVWSEGYYADPAGSEWAVLSSRGRALARVRMPPGVFVLEIGEDYVLALRRDDLDVESVVMLRLHRS